MHSIIQETASGSWIQTPPSLSLLWTIQPSTMNWRMNHPKPARLLKKHSMEQEMKLTKWTFPGCSGEHQLGSSEHQLGSLSDDIIRGN